MLKELVALTAKQGAVRDVAALGARVLHDQAAVVGTVGALVGALPPMLRQLGALEASQVRVGVCVCVCE